MHDATRRRLGRALDQYLIDIHDNGFIPEDSPLEGWEASRAPDAYPLHRVLDLADRAITRRRRHLPEFTGLLRHQNEAMRYWAAQGLLILGPESAPAVHHLARTLTKDPSPQVRITAAETLIHLDHNTDRAVDFLADTLEHHNDPRVRLQALNALTSIPGEAARAAYSAVQKAALDENEYLRNAGRYLEFVLDGTYTPASPVFAVGGGR